MVEFVTRSRSQVLTRGGAYLVQVQLFLPVPSLALLIYHNTFSYWVWTQSQKPHLNTLAVTIDGIGMGNKDSCETYKACGQSISLSSLLSRLRIHGVPDMCIAMTSQSNRASVIMHIHSAMLAQACVYYVWVNFIVENKTTVQGNVGNCTIYGKSNCLKRCVKGFGEIKGSGTEQQMSS